METTETSERKELPPLSPAICSPSSNVKEWHTKVAEIWIPQSTLTLQVAKEMDDYQRKIARLHLAQHIAANEPPSVLPELVNAAKEMADNYCTLRCGHQDHTPICARMREALPKSQEGKMENE